MANQLGEGYQKLQEKVYNQPQCTKDSIPDRLSGNEAQLYRLQSLLQNISDSLWGPAPEVTGQACAPNPEDISSQTQRLTVSLARAVETAERIHNFVVR